MPRIGVTGHANLTADTVPIVTDSIRAVLGNYVAEGLVGVTCLARGADQIFAQVVLELGGDVEVVLPAMDYRERKVKPNNVAQFDDLINKARQVHTMPFERSNSDAYMAASEHILATVERIVAVWDGEPGGHGGTGDVVTAARGRGTPVVVVWPDGAKREG